MKTSGNVKEEKETEINTFLVCQFKLLKRQKMKRQSRENKKEILIDFRLLIYSISLNPG